MEINGEVNIEIDQYADVSIEIDTEQLAEELAINHNFVDDVVLHAYVEEQLDERMDDYELRVQVDDVSTNVDELRVNVAHAQAEFEGELQDLRDQVSELEPDNNYVRINDLHTTIKEVVDARLIELFTRIIKEG
jgi:predicted regulator of amino acid metabolism with ACT domain